MDIKESIQKRLRLLADANDLGLSSKDLGEGRLINKDGSFNILRRGVRSHIYQRLNQMSWPAFLCMVFLFYIALNVFFACMYMLAGIENIHGLQRMGNMSDFISAFHFSAQTMTTVGYGAMYPISAATNVIATIEALVGLLCFALATGLVYGRFSRPTADIKFSDSAIIAPYKGGSALEMRIANRRRNQLMDVEARMLITMVEEHEGKRSRRYQDLNLEMSHINFMPLNWTIVHPIDEDSPLYGMGKEELEEAKAEFLLLIRAYDDGFSQILHSRTSYKYNELDWEVKFKPAFRVNDDGKTVFDLEKLSATEPAPLPK